MRILCLTVTLHAPWLHSLKQKRSEVKMLLAALRSKFNVSACESAGQDLHQSIVLSIAALAADGAQASSMGEAILRFIESRTEAEVVSVERELL